MFANSSSDYFLSLTTLGLSTTQVYPAFVFGTLTYLFIVFCNLLLIVTIAVSRKLHKPMFILLFSLPVSDIMGATAFFPQFLLSIVLKTRLVSYPACVVQAFLVHLYGSANLLTLTAMAYDRFVAICIPLRYNSIMNSHRLITMVFLIWFVDLSMILTLLLLFTRFKICRKNIVDLYCNNPSLVKLVCEDTSVNNLYGIVLTLAFQGGTLLIILYTYAQILRTCIMTNQADARRKAIQTCGTHLVVFLFLQINTVFTLISHRLQSVSPFLRRTFGVSVLIFPPILNPIIYGLKTNELKQNIIIFLKRNVGLTK
ncbi:putative gustatory receptor clone PTE03 [Salarias fasciatus]|nr:putative gustatory receptor clone PTE03 [Salarias fasciatus]